jgi:hypothetical protein
MAEIGIAAGDHVLCERCRRDCTVRTYQWETPVQIIVCHDGICLVGVDGEPIPPHLLVDYRHLDELVV